MPAARMPSVLLAFALAACSQEPYLLDRDMIDALDGALPDGDPLARQDRDEPGHELEGEDLEAPETFVGEHQPIAPELQAVFDSAGEDPDEEVSQGLLYANSPLSLVRDNRGWPHRSTVQLYIQWKTGEKRLCSGTLVRPDAVLTAAHCVYQIARRGWAHSITARPGAHGVDDPEPFEAIGVKRSFAPKSYRDNDGTSARAPHDYAIVRLKRTFAVATRTLAAGSQALGRPFVVRGYPGEFGYDGTLMHESRDRIRAIVSSGVFQHRASTTGGMSGAGIDDGRNVVGVHTSGPPDGYNIGVVFGPDALANVRKWATLSL